MGAISSAYKAGIKIPQDLSIIGYDNIKSAEMSIPPLTTVAQPLYTMGETGAVMIFDMLQTGETVESKILQHFIVERETVAKKM